MVPTCREEEYLWIITTNSGRTCSLQFSRYDNFLLDSAKAPTWKAMLQANSGLLFLHTKNFYEFLWCGRSLAHSHRSHANLLTASQLQLTSSIKEAHDRSILPVHIINNPTNVSLNFTVASSGSPTVLRVKHVQWIQNHRKHSTT